ncbi:aconitate hydratase AcnA [Novosphingobium sp. KACC 22771]|uniref:aconitate hydratase AcnA n=1 Tax=Novosphingobium sp. KACC 22771 TaxID=3025670 RepID=UPI0023652D75|nr:aconitate hydratase AcnA [Novosphingobium sp. KACC 22771]WDF75134.1 aconitate hydratase AcnA [Novosphingobium sp. KACC 22771]
MLSRLHDADRAALAALPRSLIILLENILAHEADPAPYIAHFRHWLDHGAAEAEIPFRPSRILMQDTAGVAALADLAALRDHAAAHGFAPGAVDAAIPIDLVIDHSVHVDYSGVPDAAARNLALEYARNGERYRFFKWAERAFDRLNIVPPGQGICHQINLERLTSGCVRRDGRWMAETVIGTDSHTTMVNALGVLGWGVGGIEAELAALGAPVPIPLPRVVEVCLEGRLAEGVTATDAALFIAARLREADVVDQIVEFSGTALDHMSLPDRAAVANMCPEYGATAALFPVDGATLAYMAAMGRPVEDYEAYARATGLWRDAGPPRRYSRRLVLDLGAVGPIMAGPSRPQQIVPLAAVSASLREHFPQEEDALVAIAAITSCTNTANPALMVAAGLVAQKAVERGLSVPPWVKTSLAPGSPRIAALLEQAGLQESLDALGFHVVGFGCTTCVGNSGDLKPEAGEGRLLAAVLSGNRNFENRIHPAIRANYLASPPLVVAAALAGRMGVNLAQDALGTDRDGAPVFLRDLWPDAVEVSAVLHGLPDTLQEGAVDSAWADLDAPDGPQFPWDPASTMVLPPPFFECAAGGLIGDLHGARALLVLGDNVTTDHISPIGRIAASSPAAAWLRAHGQHNPGSYGEQRANDRVMLRGTFDNARLLNHLASGPGNRAPGPDGAEGSVFAAAQAYADQGVPLLVFAGARYGTGSARDWAAKGTALLGIRAVIARSFERIHRANLVAMGVLPIVWDQDAAGLVRADSRIAILGIDRLGADCGDLIIAIDTPGKGIAHYPARADVGSAGQIALLRDGGLFARFARRFG